MIRKLTFYRLAVCILTSISVSACGFGADKLAEALKKPFTPTPVEKHSDSINNNEPSQSISNILRQTLKVDTSRGIKVGVQSATVAHPALAAAISNYSANLERLEITRSKAGVTVDASVYGGVENLSDKRTGAALVLSANRIVFDGGQTEAQVLAAQHRVAAAKHNIRVAIDQRALELASTWVELEKYERLNALIGSRLTILDPLIVQLEKVAAAGVGDITQVASAQRTVTSIRVVQSDVQERLEQEKIRFLNAYGSLPKKISLTGMPPLKEYQKKFNNDTVNGVPALQAGYESYLASEADLAYVSGKKKFSVNFEARGSQPFDESDFDDKVSVGFVARKNFYDSGRLDAEISEAEARVQSAVDELRILHREGSSRVQAAKQNIRSMEKLLSIAEENAKTAREEIEYLRKQLVIGGSTLESVLSSEARLYEAESKTIEAEAGLLRSKLAVSAALGRLGENFGITEKMLTDTFNVQF